MEAVELDLQNEIETENLRLMLEAAYLYLSMQKYSEAQAIFEGVAALAPESEVPLVGLGNVYFVQYKFDQAIKTYEKAIKLVPDSAFALAYMGESLMFKGEQAKAKTTLNKAAMLDPQGKSGDFARSLLVLMDKGFDPQVSKPKAAAAKPSRLS